MNRRDRISVTKSQMDRSIVNGGRMCLDSAKELGKYLGDNQIALYASKQVSFGQNTIEGIIATIKLIENIFASKGFSKEEASAFISKNRHIFERTYKDHVSVLAILSIIHLDDEAIFERPGYMQEKHNLGRLYDAVKTIRAYEEDPSLERVRQIEKDETKEIDYGLTKEKLAIYQKSYLSTLKRKVENQNKEKVLQLDNMVGNKD